MKRKGTAAMISILETAMVWELGKQVPETARLGEQSEGRGGTLTVRSDFTDVFVRALSLRACSCGARVRLYVVSN